MRTEFDPRKARQFAGFLGERAADLKGLNAETSRNMLDMQLAHWNDAKYRQFERRFEESSAQLQRFLEHAEKYAEYLRKKAAHIEQYLGRRYPG